MVSLLVALLVSTAPPRIVAAPPWSTVNASSALAGFYADQLAVALRARGVKVISASDIVALIGVERQRQLLGCHDSGCIAEIGNALGCDATLVVSFAKLDDTLRASLRILSTSDASVLSETTINERGERAFADALERAADGLVGPLPSKPSQAIGVGWVWASGLTAALAAAAGSITAGVAFSQYNTIETQSLAYSDAVARADSGRLLQSISVVAFAVAGAAVVTSIVLAVVRGRPAMPRALTNALALRWELP